MEDGYAASVYMYEAIRDHSPKEVVGNLFDRINEHMSPSFGMKIVLTDHSVGGWQEEEKKRIWHPDEPAIYRRHEISELHNDAKSSNGLAYKKYSADDLTRLLSDEDRMELRCGGVYDVYECFRRLYVASSNLELRPIHE